ncbi:MAG: cyclic nucleotide-binding domain-containing protein, partial [Anaerolineaceae bacterium]|nr:cyclic nucleotide-binding domain-containing protein [Anaerolineaceae bacterium]
MGQISEKMLPYLKEVYPFSDLDSETLALILPTLEEIQVPAGTVIFAANDPANALYFLLSGKVTLKLQKKKEAQPHTLQQFDPYDHFGEESLFTARRMTTAITTTPAVLVFLSRANLEALRQESALLDRIFKMFAATFHNLCVTEFRWRSPGETLYIVLRDNPFFLWMKLIPIGVLSLSGFGW